MIKFFRKIRQKLLEQNRVSKYLVYALGEIILVVIGILIALQVNNWNDNRINTRKQNQYLIELKNDLEKQINAFDRINNNCDRFIETAESILEDFSVSGSFLKIDSINKKLSVLMYTDRYSQFNTTFVELNSTGQLNIIKNKKLRSQIITFYQNSEGYKEWVNLNIANVLYQQVFPKLLSIAIVNPNNFEFENKNIALIPHLKTTFQNHLSNSNNIFELSNALSIRLIAEKSTKIQIKNAKSQALDLLETINENIK